MHKETVSVEVEWTHAGQKKRYGDSYYEGTLIFPHQVTENRARCFLRYLKSVVEPTPKEWPSPVIERLSPVDPDPQYGWASRWTFVVRELYAD